MFDPDLDYAFENGYSMLGHKLFEGDEEGGLQRDGTLDDYQAATVNSCLELSKAATHAKSSL